jgi:hypothetical protein
MARIRVFTASQNPLTDRPSFCSKNTAARLIRTASAVLVASRTIQLLPLLQARPVKATREIERCAAYDCAVNLPPIGYQAEEPTKLMFSQMWEKRESAGFEILQMCPPHRKPAASQ